ncbi:uncharacterized protein LOC115006338 isoform X2 [Cottoperca gobio]|uniref:Uncharacterized protein LOC115006338 isoform X2 n=1 Tax=Cottoperca gobio TaxID=56716 RepID=A0A6J2PGF3_COTGO|nr:uncharacterized protein LOC115006338 isoform X2 [Cottoperca gobio]
MDDLWIDNKIQREEQSDTLFTVHRVGLNHSGSYSCVYSLRNDLLPKVAKRGHNIIEILVVSNFLPADISVAGPSTVGEGDDVTFRCTASDTLQTIDECQLIHSYLRKNDSILQVQTFHVTRREAIFTIEGAVMRDSGDYSCVVLPSKCIQEHEKTLYGNNTVVLKVKGNMDFRMIITCGVITLMLLLGLGLWWINKRAGHYLSKSFVASLQADMVEEQQVQTEGEDLEAQDVSEDSFSMEQDEEYQNVSVQAVPHADDFEGVYNMINDDDEYDDIELRCAN